MIKTYFKIAWRKLTRNKLYTAVNLIGLTVGLTSCMLIALYIINEKSYDQFHQNLDRIARVTMEYGEPGSLEKTVLTGTKAGPQLQRSFPQIKAFVRVFNSAPVISANGKLFREDRFLYADSSFLDVFSFKLLAGNKSTALNAPDKVLLTRAMATRYFGYQDPIGKTLRVDNNREYEITGLISDAPENSQIKYDFVASFASTRASKTEEWWTANYITYILLQPNTSLASLQEQVTGYMKVVSKKELEMDKGSMTYQLQPMADVHLHSSLGGLEVNGDLKTIYVISIISILILVIACINYTNLSTVQSTARAAEIGIRKVLGAQRRQLFGQFIGESFLLTFISLVLACALAAAMMPYFNELTGKQLELKTLLSPLALGIAFFFCIIIGFVSGSYPALLLSNAKLINTLKSGIRLTSSNGLFRKSLIVFQFAVSICLIICTLVIVLQLDYMRTRDIGYNKDHVIVMPISWQVMDKYEGLLESIRRNPNVISVTGGNASPSYAQWGDNISADNGNGKKDLIITALPSDLGYIKTMDMKMVAGADFTRSDFSLMDTSDNGKNFRYAFILNETAVRDLGFTPEQAIGRTAFKGTTPGLIRGVVKDFNFASLHQPIGPLMLFLDKDFTSEIFVKTNGKNTNALIAFLSATWKERIPDRPFEYKFLDEDYNKLYIAEQKTVKIFSTFSTLAILLACLGLFGLAAFATLQRVREIGIRKVLGASVTGIILLISKEFIKLTIIAILIASPVAWFFMQNWLKDFAFRINLQWWVFAVAGLAALVIAFVTVGLQSVKAATMNPVRSLKGE
ncbi:MAG: FtsX-like permease family protein [Chitinophagaceae bacterium]